MKQKSSKLRKLENNRYSILTNDLTRCYICKKPKEDIHEIYGGANRKVSMANGFCVPLCRNCHFKVTNDNALALELKQICQTKYEETHTREEWFGLIGRNYVKN